MHETPNRRCGQRSEGLGYKVPAGVDIAACRGDVLGLKPQCDIWRHSITAHVIVTTLSFLSTWCWQLAPTALNGIRQKSCGFCKAGWVAQAVPLGFIGVLIAPISAPDVMLFLLDELSVERVMLSCRSTWRHACGDVRLNGRRA